MDIVELLTNLPECLQAKVLQSALRKAADLPPFLLICKTTNSMLNESLWRQLYAAQGRHAPDNVDLLELKSSYFQRGNLRHQEVAGEEGVQGRERSAHCCIYGVPSGVFSLSICTHRYSPTQEIQIKGITVTTSDQKPISCFSEFDLQLAPDSDEEVIIGTVEVLDAMNNLRVTVESPDRLDLLQSIQLHGPVASGEVLEVTPCWLHWTGFTEQAAFRCSNTAGREPYGPRLYIGRGQSSYDGPLRLGKARAGLGVACPTPAGESDASRQSQILQNLDQFTWVTVDSHSIANIAQQRGVGLISRGSSFGGNILSSGRREMYACRVQFTGWQVDPVRPRNSAEMRNLGHFRDSHTLPEGELFTRQQLAAALRALFPGKETVPARLWKGRHLVIITKSSCQFSTYSTRPKTKNVTISSTQCDEAKGSEGSALGSEELVFMFPSSRFKDPCQAFKRPDTNKAASRRTSLKHNLQPDCS